ncbi:hypothetical protein HMPREF9441_03644 [Paraprevotella clara YIT 11840]|uniref:Uncharacterized protein n=1 Tax=Paraprevotella clara YIT 11840 TaxID=762968 RepID=G5SW72_9BACT|nr:hypothetical protein HMPREF9441_03644 [Paraprevotella clara YIT 11840]
MSVPLGMQWTYTRYGGFDGFKAVFCGFSSFCIIDFLPNNNYLVYLHMKIIRYGKGYPCAFTA